MAGNWWQNDTVVSEQQAPQGRGGVFIPDEGAIADAKRADTSLGYQGEGNQRDNARFSSDIDNRRLEQTDKLSERYNKDPTIAGYRESLGNFATALRTSDTPQGDNALITAYVKVFDPGSVVNEGEREGVSSSQGALANIVEKAKRDFGMSESGLFTPEARARIRAEMSNIMGQRVKGYNQRRSYYEQQAQAFNLDPNLILGQHDATPFIERFREYDRANRLGEYAPGRESGEQNPFAGVDPSQITFDMDTGTGAFGDANRLTPQQEAQISGYLAARAGDPNFNPAELQSFAQSIGIQGTLSLPDETLKAIREGKPFGQGVAYADTEGERRAWAEQQVRDEMNAMGMDSINSAPLSDKGFTGGLSDELFGVRDGIRNILTGNGTFMQGYRDGRDIVRASQRMSREENGAAPEVISSLMTPAGMVSRANMARDAAAMGAIAGFGEGEGLSDSAAKMVTGAGLGYGGGKLVEKIAPAIANSAVGQKAKELFTRAPNTDAQEFAAAAERQGLDYLPADVPGATKTQFATSVSKATLGGIPLADAAKKISAKAQEARSRIAGNVGEAADNAGAGQAAQRGMEAWKAASGDRGGKLYDAIPIKPDTIVDMSATKAKLTDLNGAISSNAELAALVRDPKMLAYQKALEAGDLSWNDIKQFRSYIGEKAGRPTLQQDTSKDSLDALYGALSQDIERAAAAHSPEAAKAFSRANNYWRGRQGRINDVMTRIVGKDGNQTPEATFAQIERWANTKGGDFGSLARMVRSLPEDEANVVRSTIIDRLGNKVPGDDSTFSTDAFLTQWSKLSDRGKAILFQGDHRKALDDLVTVFDGSKASRGFDNNSKTGLINTALTSGAVGLVDPVSGLAFATLQYGGGRLLSSPRVARWLVALTKKPNPSAQLAHIGQLTSIARAEPLIANDIFTLQQRLSEAFSQPQSLRAAAEENDNVGDAKVREGERNGPQ